MRPAAILPLDPSTPLIDVLRAVPSGEPCGIWVAWGPAAAPPRAATLLPSSGGRLFVGADLGRLLRAAPLVMLRFEGAMMAVPSTVLALARMLEIQSGPCAEGVRLADRTPEAVLAEWRAGGRPVDGSRVRYAGR